MPQSGSSAASQPAASAGAGEKIQHLSESAREAYRAFQAGDTARLDVLIDAILADFNPRQSAATLAQAPGDSRLIEDLGFDSLAITEVVFFTEDLFKISISNEELLQVLTLGELRAFVRRKIAAQADR